MYFFERVRAIVKRNPIVEVFFRSIYVKAYDVLERDRRSRMDVNPYSQLEDRFRVIFVHIPKNAGNGVAQSVFGMSPKGHNFLSHYQDYDIEKYTSYYKFCFVRNPWDRFYSAYEYLRKGGFGVYDKEFYDKYMSGHETFESFVLALKNKELSSKILLWTHFIPQVEFMKNVNGDVEFDFIGKYENIDSDMLQLAKNIGVSNVEFRRVNSSDKLQYSNMYTDEMRLIVSQLYSLDVEMFGYDF